MTAYAEGLIQYVMQNSEKTREQAIEYLDKSATPIWRMSYEQPEN